jgi:hypothetical protein
MPWTLYNQDVAPVFGCCTTIWTAPMEDDQDKKNKHTSENKHWQ